MTQFIEFLNKIGIDINDASSPIILFSCCILVLSIIALLCVINIILYYFIIKLFEIKGDKIVERLPVILNYIVNIYKHTRLYYILFEVILLIICLCSIIWLCSRVVYGLM